MKILSFVFAAFVLASCASISPVGNWDYKITGTPQGDYSGTLVVTKNTDKTFTATMKSEGGEMKFNQFKFESKTKKSTGDFDYQGMNIYFDTTIKENQMAGNVSVQGMTFPFTATKKK